MRTAGLQLASEAGKVLIDVDLQRLAFQAAITELVKACGHSFSRNWKTDAATSEAEQAQNVMRDRAVRGGHRNYFEVCEGRDSKARRKLAAA